MSIELLLVRHGNTFGPGDPVVWVGKGQDLPLVDSGRAQAEALGARLAAAGWTPTAALSGGLKRQVEHLGIALGALPDGGPAPARLDALDEVDYGAWGGLSTEEIVRRFGQESVTAWNERSQWPADGGWPETRASVVARVASFARRVAHGEFGERVLVCSSNGLLRWFLDLVPGELERAIRSGTFKVRTGHASLLRAETGAGNRAATGGEARWTVSYWNEAPGSIPLQPGPPP